MRGCSTFPLLPLCLLFPAALSADGPELFEFFREEARVVTPSRRLQPVDRAPATVYVIDAEQLATYGPQTLWDALRLVPGVDVVSARAHYGTVGIRGLGKVLNNRVLVLVDGRRVLEGFTDNVSWQTLAVLLEEIERIEVVEGPASSLYGANAINGVINIITRVPGEDSGGRAGLGVGQPGTVQGHVLLDRRLAALDYRLGLSWRRAADFQDAGSGPATVGKAHFVAVRSLGDGGRFSLDAGGTLHDTDISLSGLGWGRQDGAKGFVRAGWDRAGSRVRADWSRSEARLTGFTSFGRRVQLDYQSLSLVAEHEISVSADHGLVVGAEARRNDIDSDVVAARQDLWALFAEHEWRLARDWVLWSSGRLDRHPEAGTMLSPRLSLVFVAAPGHTLRLSSGTAFRYPTLLENHLHIDRQSELPVPVGSLQRVDLALMGSLDLAPERMAFLEAAYSLRRGRLRTRLAAFHYRLDDVMSVADPRISAADSTRLTVNSTFANGGQTRAWGGELSGVLHLRARLQGFASYSYQRLRGELDPQTPADGGPHHKLAAGGRYQGRGLRVGLSVHRISATRWSTNRLLAPRPEYRRVAAYTIVSGRLAYRLSGALESLELRFDAFNLLGNEHFETLAEQGELAQGQGGERIGARRLLALDYRF